MFTCLTIEEMINCKKYCMKFLVRFVCTGKAYEHNDRVRNVTLTSFYNQPAVEAAAMKHSVRLTPATILYAGKSMDGTHILRSAQYLQRELPIRIAHRIVAFHSLPFIVGCNPIILDVLNLYVQTFHILNDFPPIININDDNHFRTLLLDLLKDHTDVVPKLAEGFRHCQKHIKDEKIIGGFLDETLSSRLSMRILVLHHLGLKELKPNHIGIINTNLKIYETLSKWCDFVKEMCIHCYGRAPVFKFSGHIGASFPYIDLPLDYILLELLKNAASATMEHNAHMPDSAVASLHISVASNDKDFIIRISDRGGGITHDLMEKVMQYNFTTAGDRHEDDRGPMHNIMETAHGSRMHGYGFGLPTSRAYAQHFGGNLNLYSLQGIGTDVYLRLPHISHKNNNFRI